VVLLYKQDYKLASSEQICCVPQVLQRKLHSKDLELLLEDYSVAHS
jgi:hypothetical protein